MSQWGSVSEFLNMGGYAFYVWGSYLVTFAFIIGEIILVRRNARQMQRRLKRMARLNDKTSAE